MKPLESTLNPKPYLNLTPKVGKIMAQNHKKAIILHTFGVQVESTLNPEP